MPQLTHYFQLPTLKQSSSLDRVLMLHPPDVIPPAGLASVLSLICSHLRVPALPKICFLFADPALPQMGDALLSRDAVLTGEFIPMLALSIQPPPGQDDPGPALWPTSQPHLAALSAMTATVETVWSLGFPNLALFLQMSLSSLLWGILLQPPHAAASRGSGP